MIINDRQITISAAGSRTAITWPSQSWLLSDLWQRLATPARSTETHAEYLAMPKGKQDNLKDVGGFVGGALRDGRRKGNAVLGRDIIALDLDRITAGGTDEVLRRVDALSCGYCIYSTRKHSPAAPRLRVLLPLDRTTTADEYEPISRRMAAYIGIEMADPSTFEACRLMYWPSCCADGEYIHHWADKPLLSVDGLLATYVDWRDATAWPQVPGTEDAGRRLAAKQADPEGKEGIVGSFCRVYNVYRAMDELLLGVYEPVDTTPDRYTFTGGSTTGGAVLYDSGKFLFSHHATDPAGGKLCNAFDLVRLHLYGDKDDEAKPGTPANRLPSFEAMCRMASSDSEVAELLVKERWDRAQSDFNAGEPDPQAPDDDGVWRKLLKIDTNGSLIKNMHNLKVILEHVPALRGRLQLNMFSGRPEVTGTLPWKRPGDVLSWSDDDTAQLRIWIEPLCGKISKGDLLDALAACASNHAFHPVRDYLNALKWDGIPRLDTLFIDYLGSENSEYVRAVTRKSFVAAVARIMEPGIKYDTMPVLVGAQGRHKSTALAIMGGAWFSDSVRTFEGKDAMESIQGKWLNEIAEMHAMANSEINAVKAFLTKSGDYYRAAYGHYTVDRPRQCVFFGTTNSKECLVDTTGGRRFWPIDIDQQPRVKNVFADLRIERDQLWAEAVVRYRLGEQLHLPPALEEQARVIQEDHRARHPWEGLISDFLEASIPEGWSGLELHQRQAFNWGTIVGEHKLMPRRRICAVEVWCEVLGKPKGDFSQRSTREINSLLERLHGWESVGVRNAGKPYGKQRCFDRITATDAGATDAGATD